MRYQVVILRKCEFLCFLHVPYYLSVFWRLLKSSDVLRRATCVFLVPQLQYMSRNGLL